MHYCSSLIIVSEADLSNPIGGMRITSLASELQAQGIDVSLIATLPPGAKPRREAQSLKIFPVPHRNTGSIVGYFKLMRALIAKTKELLKDGNTPLLIAGSTTGGYFVLAGFTDYILDVNDLIFPGVKYSGYFFSRPPFIKLYEGYTSFLEKMAIRRARNVIAVSRPMKEFMVKKWKLPERKITVIPNGYFKQKADSLGGTEEIEGIVSFIGYMTKLMRLDKILAAAKALKEEGLTFCVMGDGPYRSELELLARRDNLTNVTFTGYVVSMDEAYEMLAKSQVVLFPCHRSLVKDVSCPVKLIDYMGLGKAMVVDNVSEVASILKQHDAALVCDPDNESEFIENIRLLFHDDALRARIAANAKKLAPDFSWERQGEKLARLVKEQFNKVRVAK